MERIRISVVSFSNTYPFLYGLEHSGLFENFALSRDVPSECARKLISREADIGLVPVAKIKDIENASLLSDYCIGSVGAVKTVLMMSNQPAGKIKRLMLDPDSETSNRLAQVLLKEYWKNNPLIEFMDPGSGVAGEEGTAWVVIGDKAMRVSEEFDYVYDLSEEWFHHTGLPFVFAAWIINRKPDIHLEKSFNNALKFGLDHMDDAIATYQNGISASNLKEYYLKNISFSLDDKKRKALQLFLDKLDEYGL